MNLDELIKRTEAKLAAETTPKGKAKLAADLAMYTATRAECDDGEDGDEDDDEDEKRSNKSSKTAYEDEEKKSAKHSEEEEAKTSAARTKQKKSEEDEDEAEESAKATLAQLEKITGLKGHAMVGAVVGSFARLDRVEKDTAELKATAVQSERAELMKRAERFVPKAALTAAAEHMKLPALRAYVAEVAKGSPLVPTEEGDLLIPKATTPGTEAVLPKAVVAQIEEAMHGCPPGYDKKKFREELVAAVTQQFQAEQLNGAGRY